MSRFVASACLLAALLAGCADRTRDLAIAEQPTAAQVDGRVATKPFLNMPETAAGEMPRLLSQTGAFENVRTFTPTRGLLPYDLVLAFWSDGAEKSRFVAIPEGKVVFSPDGEWTFPRGTVFVKTFELATDTAHPEVKHRLETRLLVLDGAGGVYGVTYKWRADLSDAELVGPQGLNEDIVIHDPAGQRTQTWSYPSREDCVTCHNPHTPGQLGPKTRQMNRDLRYPDGATENQLRHWSRLGLFASAPDDKDIAAFVTLATADDASRSLEDRARSYLDANCAQCHRPGGTVANFDARYQTPLAAQNLIDGPVLISQGIDRPRVISPHDPWRSLMIRRTDTNDDTRMPPIARHTIDRKGVALLRQWILSLPGRDVLAPPAIQPAGGDFKTPVTVALSSSEPGAEIRYTLDGSAPGTDDPVYDKPIRIEGPTVVRARAYKEGLTRSIVVQQTYLVQP
jgi:uncharacterized repeat protein (TIGR03806 family)